jgi:hypothetical protein
VIRYRLRDEPTRKDSLSAELAALGTAAAVDGEQLLRDAKARAVDLRGLLARHVVQARQVVQLLLDGRLTCAWFDDVRGRGHTFTALAHTSASA